MGWKGNNGEDREQDRGAGQASQKSDTELLGLIRALAYLVAAKLTLNPHTQNRRMPHPGTLFKSLFHPPASSGAVENLES